MSVLIDINIDKMFVSPRIILLALVFILANGQENEQVQKKILDGIKSITTGIDWIYTYAHYDNRGFKETFDSNNMFLDFGQRFIGNLTDFASNFTMINDQIGKRSITILKYLSEYC